MRFNDYQKKSRETARYPKTLRVLAYTAMGLAGETGELLNKVKKVFRDDKGKLSAEKKEEIAAELGDVLWYLSQIATDCGLSLKDVAQGNIKKLQDRKQRGTLHGSGDKR
ncbi:MAG: nucleoside triphosphate pyrophosphohydrolase family protein [Parcubacteria group bacterium]|nr:nucleoside triphosphate pyrophosphohydrolase family protein [Parcubacteria group bacterium]